MNSYDSSTEAKPPIRFEKLGDAIKYGFTEEKDQVIGDGNKAYPIHLYASLVYLYLLQYIKKQDISAICMCMVIKKGIDTDYEETEDTMLRILFSALRGEFSDTNPVELSDLDELAKELNRETIPKWCFYAESQLIDANVILNGDELFYLIPRSAGTYASGRLVKINVREIREGSDLCRDFCENVIDCDVSRIFGYDGKLQRLYYESYEQRMVYFCYDFVKNRRVAQENRMIELAGDFPVIVTEDGFLAYVTGENIHCLKKYDESEYYEYDEKTQCFLVCARSGSGRFFRPFYISLDGSIDKVKDDVYKGILWMHMEKGIRDIPDIETESGAVFYFDDFAGVNLTPEKITIAAIEEKMLPRGSKWDVKKKLAATLLKEILNIAGEALGDQKDADITELLYTLCEADAELNSHDGDSSCNAGDFPSEKLYWRLREFLIENNKTDRSLEKIISSGEYFLLLEELLKKREGVRRV